MTMNDGPVQLVVFRDMDGLASEPHSDRQEARSVEYLKARERAERAAAKNATSLAARCVHQELAQQYARRAGSDQTGTP